jgi:signal transduction histidine kinase/CheY-like chemotaxis protein
MENKIISKCPITGSMITTHPDWTNVTFGADHWITFKVIDQCILLCESTGTVSIESLKGTLNLSLKIIEENFADKPFVYMEDLSKVATISIEGRKYYIAFLRKLKNMKTLLYFNANPFIRFSIKLAKKLSFFEFDINTIKTYSEAVYFAFNILGIEKKQNFNEYQNWDIQLDGYSASFEVVNNNILHINSEGVLGLEHIEFVIEYQNNFIKNNFQAYIGNYYFVVNLSRISITRECRRIYANEMQLLYAEFPFDSYVYYGASRLLDIVVSFVSPLISFKVKKVHDFKEVLDFVNQNNISQSENLNKTKNTNEIENHIDEFIEFLGKVNWENNGFDSDFNKDITHPFYKVYDAIILIKSDLDELSLERKKHTEEKAILEHKLSQSLKLEAIGKIAGSVAHDLNNVLSGIVSYPYMILKELPQIGENEKAIKYIKRMETSGHKAADIVQDLLTLSRRGAIDFEFSSLNSIIEEYLKSPEFIEFQYSKPKVTIEFILDENLNSIHASQIHLSKTIMNLVRNGVEAIPDEGIVKIITKNVFFENKKFKSYKKTANGNYVELMVSDTGLGISEQDIPKIFEPFYSKKKMGSSGTGLGMMVIKGAIDDHKGFIQINSELEKGTEFKLYFPVKKGNINKNIVQKIGNYTGAGQQILVIDDDEDQRIIAHNLLEGLYYSVKTCSSGEEAIEYLKKEKADLIVLDMIMAPGIGGLETFREIKRINPQQKAIIVSGYSATKDVVDVQNLGAGKYIRKPYTVEDLGIAVFEELQK